MRVYQDSVGHWYCSFVVPAQAEPLPATGRVIGIDWGVKETATTTSEGHDLPHAGHGRKAKEKLTRYDRMMARRKPGKGQSGSKGYREAKKLRAKAYKKVARQRQDTGRKWAKKVVTDHDALAVEDFKPKFLAKTTMARKATDAAIGATKAALIEMGRKHGRTVHLVHPAHTTMDCAHCGARAKHALPLGERIYTCTPSEGRGPFKYYGDATGHRGRPGECARVHLESGRIPGRARPVRKREPPHLRGGFQTSHSAWCPCWRRGGTPTGPGKADYEYGISGRPEAVGHGVGRPGGAYSR